MKKKFALMVFAASLAIAPASFAQDDAAKPKKADNTRQNKEHDTTADQAKNNKTDRVLAQQIRKAIMKDKSLSTYAHNVKIIAMNGGVTVKGPVRTEEERAAIMAKAKEVAGATNVTDELTVAPKK